jgi:hypothetical protein
LKAVEEAAPGQDQVRVYYQGRGLVAMDLRTALREMGDQFTGGEKACAEVREFIDGPSRDRVRAKQRASLADMAAHYADLAKRLKAARKARGIE